MLHQYLLLADMITHIQAIFYHLNKIKLSIRGKTPLFKRDFHPMVTWYFGNFVWLFLIQTK